VITAVLQCDIW